MAASNDKKSLPELNDPNRPKYLADAVDSRYDHTIGAADAKITVVEYGSYASSASATAHEVVASLHTRFGTQMRYVFSHHPVHENKIARQAAVVSEYLSLTSVNFWDVHNELMGYGNDLDDERLRTIASDFGVTLPESQMDEAEKKIDRNI